VGWAPRPAADPLDGLLARTKSRTRGSGADAGVRPTSGCGRAALWGRPSLFVACQRLCKCPGPAGLSEAVATF
jgi:hypothetical protein